MITDRIILGLGFQNIWILTLFFFTNLVYESWFYELEDDEAIIASLHQSKTTIYLLSCSVWCFYLI